MDEHGTAGSPKKFAADPDLLFASIYNYDTMRGQPEVERAMLDAMAEFPAGEAR